MPLTNQEKLKKLARLAEADQPVKVFQRLEKLSEDTEKLTRKDAELEAEITVIAEAQNALKTDLETHTEEMTEEMSQAVAEKLSRSELEAIKPELKGDKGDDYILTSQDKREIAETIEIPVVEKIIERTEVIKEQPIVTNEIKEVAVADTPDQIRDKLESLQDDSRLSISAIYNLEEILDELKRRPVGRGGGGFSKIALESKIIDDETPAGSINGSNTVFTLANVPNPNTSLKVYRGGARQRITEDYTFSGGTITFTVAPVVGEIILADYRV